MITKKNSKLIAEIIGEQYMKISMEAFQSNEKLMTKLLANRRLPEPGWSDQQIESLLQQLSLMDANNYPSLCGIGEREGRIFSNTVKKRNFYMGHGIGRSGFISAI